MKKEKRFYKVHFNKEGGRVCRFYERDFGRRFVAAIASAEDRYLRETAEGREWAHKVATSNGEYDDEKSPFWADFVGNFNRYCDTWSGPRGVEPIYQIEIERTFGGKK